MFLLHSAAAECVWCMDIRIYQRANKSQRSEVCKVSRPHLTHAPCALLAARWRWAATGRERVECATEAWANQKVLLPLPETRSFSSFLSLSLSLSHAAPPVPRHFNKGKCLRCALPRQEREKSQKAPFALQNLMQSWEAGDFLNFGTREQIFDFRLISHSGFFSNHQWFS